MSQPPHDPRYGPYPPPPEGWPPLPAGPYPPRSGPPGPGSGPPWPPQPPFQDPYMQTEQQKAGLFKAGKVALWVWIVVTVVPVVLIVGCCASCWGMGLLGAVLPSGDPSPTPTW